MKIAFVYGVLWMTIFILPGTRTLAQDNRQTDSIVAEGKSIYRSEMASWFGTDIFLEKFSDKRNQVGGYFSYADGTLTRCVFFSKGEQPAPLAFISFDSTFHPATAVTDDSRTTFTAAETELLAIRQAALAAIRTDTLFKSYPGSNLNLIPLITDDQKKVYVLTGPEKNGVVIFGNDYLLTFDSHHQLLSTKRLHNNIIPTRYGDTTNGQHVVVAMHSHLQETGDYLTATDVATLMLYEKFAGWEQYVVISPGYVSLWNCEKNTLLTLTREAWEKIYSTDNERKLRKKKRKP